MKSINQEAVLLDQTGLTPYQVIERVGRTCYQSLDKITDDSAKPFVERLFKAGHHAALEFGYVYVKITDLDLLNFIIDTSETSYIRYIENYVVGSLRAFYDWLKYLFNASQKYEATHDFVEECKTELLDFIWGLSELYPEIFHAMYDEFCAEFDENHHYSDYDIKAEDVTNPFKFMSREEFIQSMKNDSFENEWLSHMIPHTVMFTTNRGIGHELSRHRPGAHMMESTRYCKYDEGITVIKPMFEVGTDAYKIWQNQIHSAETVYRELRKLGESAQASRGVLPLDTKCDYWMSFYEDGWQHILNLRYHGKTGAPHPQMKELMGIAYPQLVEASEGRIK